jgi:hypothetical protein
MMGRDADEDDGLRTLREFLQARARQRADERWFEFCLSGDPRHIIEAVAALREGGVRVRRRLLRLEKWARQQPRSRGRPIQSNRYLRVYRSVQRRLQQAMLPPKVPAAVTAAVAHELGISETNVRRILSHLRRAFARPGPSPLVTSWARLIRGSRGIS